MKKLISLALAVMCVFCFASCKKGSSLPRVDTSLAEGALVTREVPQEFASVSTEVIPIDTSLADTQRNAKDNGELWKCFQRADGQFDSVANFDAAGNLKDYQKFLYDEDGRQTGIREYCLGADGTMVLDKATNFEYDEAGNIIRDYRYNADGTFRQFCEYTYDAAGNKTSTNWLNLDGTSQIKINTTQEPLTVPKTTAKAAETTTAKK